MSDVWIVTLFSSIGLIATFAAYILGTSEYKKTIKDLSSQLKACNDLLSVNREEIESLKNKAKMSKDVLAVLNEVNSEGAILHVQRINKDDIFIHNGSQYR